MRWAWVLALLASPAFGQLTLYVVDGATETPLANNSLLQLAPMEAGDSQSVRLRVRNLGLTRAPITQFSADGVGFSLNRPFPPVDVDAGAFLNATLTFSAGTAATYSANLRMNGISVLVLANVVQGTTLTVAPNCRGTATDVIDFGTVVRGQTKLCSATLSNESAQALTVSTLTATGVGFSVSASAVPLTLGPGQSVALTLQFSSATAGQRSGTLVVGRRSYTLAAVAAEVPLAEPVLDLGSGAFVSGQQRKIGAHLASPATLSTTGRLQVKMVADAAVANVDPTVMFVESGTTSIAFSVTEGSTAVTFGGRDAVTLQTGTTSGRMEFSFTDVSAGLASNNGMVATIGGAPVVVDATAASRGTNQLNVTLVGYDNTYSAGQMTFRFYNASGSLMGLAMPGDFRAQFTNYYQLKPGGSVFRMTASFPVVNGGAIASVEVELTNAAGTSRTQRIPF